MDRPHASRGALPLHLLLATAAKVLCSAVFVSGRDPQEAARHSVFSALQSHHLPAVLPRLATTHVDRERREATVRVRLTPQSARELVDAYRQLYPDFEADWDAEVERLASLGELARTARYVGDQGSVILPIGDDRLRFEPEPVPSALPPAASQPWPMGDAPASSPTRSRVDRDRVAAAIAAAFDDPQAYTAAVVVVHRGEIVGERALPGIAHDTQLESWSMGKSVTATLVGRLIRMGLLSLDEPAPIEEWRGADDPRRAITVRHLMQMSSGLYCPGYDDPRSTWRLGLPDHFYVYGEALDAFAFAIDRPLEHPPGTVGRYRNCDPLALGCIVKRIVTERLGRSYLRWPQEALFDRIGVRRQTLETDLHGNFVMTGFDYGAPRNWARLGLLYLRDGVWEGERLLPEGWSRFVGSPAPAWPQANYGGQFWLNTNGDFELPRDAYCMAGSGDQRVFVVPSADLVVVRMGHTAGWADAKPSLNAMLRGLSEAVAAA